MRDVVRDPSGVLWVVAYGGGLGWVAGDDVGALPVGRGRLPDPFLSSMGFFDDQVWLQGNSGLTQVALAELEAARLDANHTLPTARVAVGEANGWRRPSAAQLGESIWLTGVDGMAVVDSIRLGQEMPAPSVEILDARVGDTALVGQGTLVPSDAWRRLEVDYTAPTLRPGLVVTYEYRLRHEHAVGAWVQMGPRRRVVVPELTPGAYLFEVRAASLGGESGEKELLAFVVEPAWYERGLVRGGIAVLLAVLALLVGLVRARNAERREAQYRQVFTQAANAFLLYGPDGACVDLNAEACRLFGGDVPALLAAEPKVLGLPEESVLQGPGASGPILCARLDGTRFPARVDVVSCALPEGEGRLWSVVDLTRLVSAHEQEARLRHQLHVAQRLEALGRLAGGVAHNMNNLFSVILSNLEQLEESPLDDVGRECVTDARQGVQSGVSLIRQLLAFSREGMQEPQDADLYEVLDGLRRMLVLLLPKTIELVVLGRPGARVGLGRSPVEQVVLNLVLNAADAAPSGSTVRAEVRVDGDRVILEVEDRGEGIPEDELEHVFEPFFTTKPVGKGTGLGLPTVRGIVDGAGGNVEIDSRPGRGTRVIVELPRWTPTAPADDVQPEADSAATGWEVVFVDDNEALVRSMRRQLARSPFEVTFHTDPLVARDALVNASGAPSLLVTDVVMPGLNGRQLATAARERWPGLRVLFISGYTADVLGDMPDAGAETLVQKPFTTDELIRAMEKLLAE